MEASVIIAIVVGIINLFALGIVAWQTYLTRKAVQINEQNLKDSEQSRFISNLPRSYSIISVLAYLENWKKDLELLRKNKNDIISNIKSGRDFNIHVEFWNGQPKGLINKGDYVYLPDWLQEILVTGAQYYTQPMCLLDSVISSKKSEDFRLDVAQAMFDRSEQGLQCINEMLTLIERLIPKWYLESPASLQDSDLLD
ncbi:MAG: hypothetical protein PHF74_04175 [Dehalococcoidales bacterium]|nr:hypothetical protein [Dehalococcoidales bacterium]